VDLKVLLQLQKLDLERLQIRFLPLVGLGSTGVLLMERWAVIPCLTSGFVAPALPADDGRSPALASVARFPGGDGSRARADGRLRWT